MFCAKVGWSTQKTGNTNDLLLKLEYSQGRNVVLAGCFMGSGLLCAHPVWLCCEAIGVDVEWDWLMKIIQVLPELNSGGVERGTVEFARELVAQGHESIVISAGGRQVPLLESQGSRHIQWPVHKKSLLSLLQVRPLRKLFLELKPDVIHVRSRVPAWLTWLALRALPKENRPLLVSTFHGMYSVNAYSAIMGKADRIIAISDAVRQYIFDNYPDVDAEKVTLVHRGVDPQEFNPEFRYSEEWLTTLLQAYPQVSGKKILLMPGRLTRWKGQLDFVDMLHQLKEKGQENVCGLIVGSSEGSKNHYEQELREKVQAYGLDDTVIFLGHRSDMRELYCLADVVFNLSNRPEPFGRTVTEALWSGTPVIAYDQGGPAEVLRSCFPSGLSATKSELVNTVEKVLSSPAALSYCTDYELHTQCEKTLRVYNDK